VSVLLMPLLVPAFSTLSSLRMRILETDDELADFIDSCLEKVLSHNAADRVVRISYRLNPSLRDVIGTDEAAGRIERLVQSGRWSGDKKLVIEQFLRERNKSSSSYDP
jgi:hypothetical protein